MPGKDSSSRRDVWLPSRSQLAQGNSDWSDGEHVNAIIQRKPRHATVRSVPREHATRALLHGNTGVWSVCVAQ